MWSLIVIGLIWYGLFGKNNPKTVRTVQQKKSNTGCFTVFLVLMVIGVGTSFLPGLFGVAVAVLALGLPIMLIGKLIQAANHEATRRNSKEIKDIPEKFKLTESVSKRQKILSKFNEKYELNLSQEQMDRIVDASYMSYSWEKEIYDMTKDYGRPAEWMKSDTSWLRAYLRAFPMMNISSDFEMQKAIVEDAFRQILTEVPPGDFYTIDAAIEETNRRFYTLFDETTYMVMFRYMQSKGMKLSVPNGLHHAQESEADRLAREYDEKVAEEAKTRKSKPVRGRKPKNQEQDSREDELDDLQAFAEETMGTLTDDELQRLIKAYDKMLKENAEGGAEGTDDGTGSDGTDPGSTPGGMRGM